MNLFKWYEDGLKKLERRVRHETAELAIAVSTDLQGHNDKVIHLRETLDQLSNTVKNFGVLLIVIGALVLLLIFVGVALCAPSQPDEST